MKNYIDLLEQKFYELKNEVNADQMQAYMKDKAAFYGVKAVKRNEVFKDWYKILPLKEEGFDFFELAVELWNREEREWQYIAMDLLKKTPVKRYKKKDIITIERLLVSKSWWDTVDILASNIVSNYFIKFPEEINDIISDWRMSENMWLNRTCLIYQLKFRDNTDFKILKSLIKQYQPNKEFFIQKAIGWSLRQHSKLHPKEVIDFIEEIGLEGLAKREGLRLITK